MNYTSNLLSLPLHPWFSCALPSKMSAPSDNVIIGAKRTQPRAPASTAVISTSTSITPEYLASELAKLSTSLHLSLTSSITTSVTQSVTEALKSEIKVLSERIHSVEFDVGSIQEEQTKQAKVLNDRLQAIEDTNLYHLIEANKQQQRQRDKTMKLHHFISDTTDSQTLLGEIFDLIILPAYNKAVTAGKISSVPEQMYVVEHGHRLRPRQGGAPAAILVVFTTRAWYNLFNEFYKEPFAAIFAPNAVDPVPNALSHPDLRIGRDLTMPFRTCMSKLYDMNAVDKVKLSGGLVNFTMSGSSTWRIVHNPFGCDLAAMQTVVPSPASMAAILSGDTSA